VGGAWKILKAKGDMNQKSLRNPELDGNDVIMHLIFSSETEDTTCIVIALNCVHLTTNSHTSN
jgi:hypothetical protein